MKFISIFLFFLLLSIKSIISFADNQILYEEQECRDYFSLNLSDKTKTQNYNLTKLCDDFFNLYVDLLFEKMDDDIIFFEIIDEDNFEGNISIYLKDSDIKAFNFSEKSIELKLSDVVSNKCLLEIYKKKDGETSNISLRYTFGNYPETKRFIDDNKYIIYPNNTDRLIYEYGISDNKTIIFTAFGNSINIFNFEYEINNNKTNMDKKFFNGYMLVMDNNFFKEDKTINFLFSNCNENLTIITYRNSSEKMQLDGNDNHFYIILNDSNECFSLPDEKNESYIFKFTTYTKNILAFFDGKNEKNITEESSYYILKSQNKSQICFQKKEGYENDKAALSFEFLKFKSNTINNYYKIIRGLPQRNILYSGMVGYYKPEYYNNITSEAVIYSHVIKGNIFLFVSQNNDNNALTEYKLENINGYISYKYKISEEPIYAKVECLSEECIFDIDMKGVDEITYFKKDYKVFSYLNDSYTDKYELNINGIDNKKYNYLLINIYYLIQKPNVDIYNKKTEFNKYEINQIENVISYNIPINETENSENIFIDIKTNNSGGIYYGLNYEFKEESNNDIYLENGIAYLIDMKNDINLKNFIIKPKADSKLIINANTFSNDLALALNGNNYISKNNLIHIELNKTLGEYYSLNIIKNSIKGEQYINLYIYEPSSDSKIYIKEGIIYNNKLTKDNNEINYSLFLNKTRNYNLNFRKYSNNNAIITINGKTWIISKLSELISIEKNDCLNNVCEYLIKIEKENRENDETELDFSFQMINYEEEIYLPKNTFINGILEEKQTIIYNGNYEDNDEFFIDFFEGEGEAILKIINSESEENYIYTMDYYNKKFNINKNICKNCNCRFKLELNLNNYNNINSKYKYSILLRDSSSQISIPAFETIYGVLKSSIKEHKYSIKKISKYYNYELDCSFCEFKEEIQTEDEIKFSIKLKEEQNIDFDIYYNFRINFHDNENVILYHLNSLRNHHYCEINDTNPCYYLVYIEEYNNKTNLQFFVQNIQNSKIYLKKYENQTEEEIYKEIVDNKINDYDGVQENYLNYEIDCKECYLLLTIISNNQNKIKVNLVYDIFKRNYSSMKNVYKDDFCLVNSKINNNTNIELMNKEEEYYILDINILKGEEEIRVYYHENINEEKNYYLLKDFKDNFNFVSSLDKNYTFQLNAKGTDSIIYYRKIKSKNKKVIKEIVFGKSNYLKYENKNEAQHQNFYININDIIIENEDIHLNYKFLTEQNYPENIDLKVILVDETYIINEKEGLNKNNLIYSNLSEINYYQKDLGAGYALLDKKSIVGKYNISYIYIELNNKLEQKFDLVITLTDFSSNYSMPININLFMLIKNETNFLIKNKEKSFGSPFVEIFNDNLLNVTFMDDKIKKIEKNGNTFFIINEGDNFEFTFNAINDNPEKMPNLLIKYGFSEFYSYFELNSNSINFDDSDKSITFYPLEINSNIPSYSITYNILIYNKNNIRNNMIDKEKPFAVEIYNDKPSNKDTKRKVKFYSLIGKSGDFNINILAEAKIKKGEVVDNYEYILYKNAPANANIKTTEDTILIRKKQNTTKYNHSEMVKIKANISLEESDNPQYEFIKLVMLDQNEEHKLKLGGLKIYASTKESFYHATENNLYAESEYKSIDSKNTTVLAIPINDIDKEFKKLYIQISCNGACDFDFQYRIESGRSMEGIKIHDNTCFDIELEGIKEPEIYMNYRFVFNISKINYPLITFTTYEINNNYKLFTTGLENNFLKNSFYNGYSFSLEYKDEYYEYHTFILKPNVTTTFKICHRIINGIKPENQSITPILIGENGYSILMNKKTTVEECFKIEKEDYDYDYYMFNYITKTQNMKLVIKDDVFSDDDVSIHYLFDESGNIILDKSIEYFCLNLRDEVVDSISAEQYHGSVNFQIIGIKENIAPLITLINGYSVKHTLKPGQIIYYRLNNKKNNSFINLYFQELKGDILLYKSHCKKYPNCEYEGDEKIKKSIYNNYYDEESIINENDADFTVYKVQCNDISENCIYYIGMHYDNSLLLLNDKRKTYFEFLAYKTFYFSTDFYIEPLKDDSYGKNSRKYYLEIHLFNGTLNTSDISINGSSILHNFENKTYYYSTLGITFLTDNFYSYNNSITFNTNTFCYITYRLLLSSYYKGKKTDDFYNMYEQEMHYNILNSKTEIFSYYYPELLFNDDDTPKGNYIVSISNINSHISIDKSNVFLKYHQFKLQKNYTLIKCIADNGDNIYKGQCEFIFSFAKLNQSSIYKNISFDGFYQYYEINDDIKNIYLYYKLSEKELNKEQIFITINKENLSNITINYTIINIDTTTDFEKLQNLPNIKINKCYDMARINLTELKNNVQLKNDAESYLLLKLTSDNNTDFKIKININNIPIYLYSDETEYGSLKKYESLYYYFDYYPEQITHVDFEEIYLYNKGNVKMKTAISKTLLLNHPYNEHDMYEFVYNDLNFKESEKNYFRLNISDINLGYRLYIRVYLDENDKSDYNSFSIYRHTQKEGRGLLAKLNNNIFGNIYENNKENYYFYIDNLNQIKEKLKISLNCENCVMKFYYMEYEEEGGGGEEEEEEEEEEIIEEEEEEAEPETYYLTINSSCIFNWDNYLKNNEYTVYFKITGGTGYYFLSFSDTSSPKYIEESELELCLGTSKFIFPLYNYSNYIKYNNTDIAKIIFFSPDYERIKIKVEVVDESKLDNNYPLTNFTIKDNSIKYTNKYFYDLKTNDIMVKDKYLRIEVEPENKNQLFKFIMNKFINPTNQNSINNKNQIITVSQGTTNNYTINNFDKTSYYKISLHLISGEGNIVLNNGNITYDLDYEYHRYITIITKLKNDLIMGKNSGKDDFNFLIDVSKLDDHRDIKQNIEPNINYRIKYMIDDNKTDIFPLNLRISREKGYTAFVSYRFIELESSSGEKTKNELYNTTISNFSVSLSPDYIEDNKINLESIYYPDFERGVIIVNRTDDTDVIDDNNYIEVVLKKSEIDESKYKKVYLEIASVLINNKEENVENIVIPKDVYVQFDLYKNNKIYNLIFQEPDDTYNHLQIDLSYTTYVNISEGDCDSNDYEGKYTFHCIISNDGKKSISLETNTSVTIFVKYITKKAPDDFPNFALKDSNIETDPEDKKYTSYKLTQRNIMPTNNYNNINYDLSYYVRLYEYLKFFKDREIDNIIVRANGIISFRVDLDKSEAEKEEFTYEVNFPNTLKNETYFINVIGAAKYKDSVEYFSYKFIKMRLVDKKDTEFNKNWIIPLVFVLIMFCAFVAYIIYINIKEYKQNKGKKKEGVADILINDGDKEKDMTDIKDEEKDTDKDKEDDDDEDNEEDDPNENLIKL